MYKYYAKQIDKPRSRKSKKNIISYSKSVLITGCDSGFGFFCSLALLSRGFQVFSACLTKEGCQKLLDSANNHPNIHPILCDVTKPKMVDNLMAQINSNSQVRLWALINNAGIALPGNIDFLTLEDYRKVMEVNYFAGVNFTQKCLPMLKESRGRIVFVSSTCGIVAMPNNSPYNASKHAIKGFADTIRQDLSLWGIKVILIEPATMKTPVVKNYWNTMRQKFLSAPEDIQESYGKENFLGWITEAEKMMEKMSENPQKVVDDIIHAVIAKKPKRRYCSGLLSKTLFKPLHIMPTAYKDRFLKSISREITPKASKNRGKRAYEFYHQYEKSQKQVYAEFVDYVWKGGAGSNISMTIEEMGDETGKGCSRFVKTFGSHGIIEKIVDTEYPNRIDYKVMNPSWVTFPVSYHRGEINFIADGPEKTTIVWKIEMTPHFSWGLPISVMFRYLVSLYLKKLSQYNSTVSLSPDS